MKLVSELINDTNNIHYEALVPNYQEQLYLANNRLTINLYS